MRNSIKNVSTLYGGINTTIDVEDDASDLLVIQRGDMVLHHTSRMASRYKVEETFWVTKTLGYNANDEVIYISTEKPTRVAPDFIPPEVL